MPSGNPHLHQLESRSEKNQSSAVRQIPIRITQPKSQTNEKKYRQMFERSRESRVDAIIGRYY
jgi:hypothetical protein